MKNGLSRKVVKGLNLANTTEMQFALVAAREAWADAGKPGVEPERLGVVVSSGVGGVAFGWADALEAVPTILALREAVAPPTIDLDDPDDEAGVDIATEPKNLKPHGGAPMAALNNSFGFGGHNVYLAFTVA